MAVVHLSGGRCAADQLCEEVVCSYSTKKQQLLEPGIQQPGMALSEQVL